MRLIDADALEDVLVNHGFCFCNESDYSDGVAAGFLLAINDVIEAPTIEAEPVRHGKWIGKPIRHGEWIGKPIGGYSRVRCSVCDDVFLENNGKWNYCPHCGAKMDEVEE